MRRLQTYVDVLLSDEDEVKEAELVMLGDKLEIPTQRTFRDSGEMIAPCVIARTGIMLYRAKDLGSMFADRDPMSVVKVMTTKEQLFADASIESYRSCPVTFGHPRDAQGRSIDVTLANNKQLQKGMLEGLPFADEEEETINGTLVLNDAETIKMVDEGYDQLSSGHNARVVRVYGKEWDAEKTNIRANHIAVVAKGRAGIARIADSVDSEENLNVDIEFIEGKVNSDKPDGVAAETPNVAKTDVVDEDVNSDAVPPSDGSEPTETNINPDDVICAEPAAGVITREAQDELDAKGEYSILGDSKEDMEKLIKLEAEHDELKVKHTVVTQRLADSETALGEATQKYDHTVLQLTDAQSRIKELEAQLADEQAHRISDAEMQRRIEDHAQGRIALLSQVAKLGDNFEGLDIKGKTDIQIKREVMTRLRDENFDNKSDAYVEARFDMALTDAEEITLSDALSTSMLEAKVEPQKYVNPAEAAKQRRLQNRK